jgi:PiT family inorganic phosphate transporter
MSIDVFFVVFACAAGLLMTWGVGANDLANIMSTTMGSKAITVRQAIIVAIVFEFMGAFFGGNHVTSTIRTGIINVALISPEQLLIYAMLSILLAGSVWMWLASFLGMPVSITNAVIGALVGLGTIVLGANTVHWEKVRYIAFTWVFSPLIAGLVSYLFFLFIRRVVLSRVNPARAILLFAPVFFFMVGLLLSVMVVLKGLAHFNITFGLTASMGIDVVLALVFMVLGGWSVYRSVSDKESLHDQLVYVEKVFASLMALTACAMVFAHGSNDVAIAVGPMAAVLGIVTDGSNLSEATPIPSWVILLGASGVIVGFVTYGKKVIATVGSGITALTPSRAFAATLAAATTVVVSTSAGTPVSATQTLVGAVLGVGLARGIGALNLAVIRNIFTSWVVTIPSTAGLAIAFFYLLKLVFN